MNPNHHPEPDELVAYASGSLPEWISVVVACHLTYCSWCREEVALYDDLGGALLDLGPADADGGPLPALDALLGQRPPEPSSAKCAPKMGVPDIPRPLHAYFAGTPRWRFFAPGVETIALSFAVGGIPARIVKFAAGFTVPHHRHEGLEMVVVLDGVLEDSTTNDVFRTGDVSRREAGSSHSQHVPRPSGPCICLVVSEAPIVPSTLWGKVLKALTGV